MHEQTRGVSWYLLHCLLFAGIATVTKLLQNAGLPLFEILLFQTGFGTLVLSIVRPKLFFHRPAGKVVVMHGIRALCWVSATLLFFHSLHAIALPRAIALSFSTPIFTTLLAVLLLKEVLHWPRIVALIAAFCGMLVIIQPGLDNFEPAALYVIGACVLWSITDILIKWLGRLEQHISTTWFFTLCSFLCLLPLALPVWRQPSMGELGWLIILGSLFSLNMLSVTIAYRLADLTVIQPFAFTQLIFVSLLSWLVFDEVISLSTFAGSLIIIGSTSIITWRERKRHKEFLAYQMGKELL